MESPGKNISHIYLYKNLLLEQTLENTEGAIKKKDNPEKYVDKANFLLN
jgi:hypothetical protein